VAEGDARPRTPRFGDRAASPYASGAVRPLTACGKRTAQCARRPRVRRRRQSTHAADPDVRRRRRTVADKTNEPNTTCVAFGPIRRRVAPACGSSVSAPRAHAGVERATEPVDAVGERLANGRAAARRTRRTFFEDWRTTLPVRVLVAIREEALLVLVARLAGLPRTERGADAVLASVAEVAVGTEVTGAGLSGFADVLAATGKTDARDAPEVFFACRAEASTRHAAPRTAMEPALALGPAAATTVEAARATQRDAWRTSTRYTGGTFCAIEAAHDASVRCVSSEGAPAGQTNLRARSSRRLTGTRRVPKLTLRIRERLAPAPRIIPVRAPRIGVDAAADASSQKRKGRTPHGARPVAPRYRVSGAALARMPEP
jgi:hypothetical protein